MPTQALIKAATAEETGEVLVMLVTIEAAGLTEPIRVASDGATAVGEHTVSRGNVYVWTWFEIELPEQTRDRPRPARLVLPNVADEVVRAIRDTQEPPVVTVEIVLASAPDVVEVGPLVYELSQTEIGAATIEGTLTVEPIDDNLCPQARFTPATTPGIFQ